MDTNTITMDTNSITMATNTHTYEWYGTRFGIFSALESHAPENIGVYLSRTYSLHDGTCQQIIVWVKGQGTVITGIRDTISVTIGLIITHTYTDGPTNDPILYHPLRAPDAQ